MFRITDKKGFHITFKNGYTVSVQFGPGNYCDHYSRNIGEDEEWCGKTGSDEAEVAVWNNKSGELIKHPDFEGDTVKGYVNAEYVLKLLNWAASQPMEDAKETGE